MIKTVIIDDEEGGISVLKHLLKKFCPNVVVLATGGDVNHGEKIIRRHNPDLVFLDIEILHGNAFDLLERFDRILFHVIFITAFDKYAIKAFKYSALDYILKPVSADELVAAVAKVSQLEEGTLTIHQVRQLRDSLVVTGPPGKTISLPTSEGVIIINTTEIIRVEAIGSYTTLYIDGRNKIIFSKPLGELEELLPGEMFFRVHKSHIINTRYVEQYNKGRGGQVIMKGGAVIDVASRRKNEFLKRIRV